MSLRNNPAPNIASGRGMQARYLNQTNFSAVFTNNTQVKMPDGTMWNDVTWDMTSESEAKLILSANTKIETPKDIEVGELYTLCIQQPDTSGGPFAVSWGAAFDWDYNGEPVLAQGNGSKTILQFYVTGNQADGNIHLYGSLFYKTPEGGNIPVPNSYQPTSNLG